MNVSNWKTLYLVDLLGNSDYIWIDSSVPPFKLEDSLHTWKKFHIEKFC